MRGAEIISAAAGSASRSSEKRGSVRFAHAHAKRKLQQKIGTGGRAQLRARASARKIRHSARQQTGTKFMNALSYQMDRLHAINRSGQRLCLHQMNRLRAIYIRTYILCQLWLSAKYSLHNTLQSILQRDSGVRRLTLPVTRGASTKNLKENNSQCKSHKKLNKRL